MGSYVLKRFLSAVPTVVGVFVVVFFVIRMIPGDPAVSMLGPGATEAQIQVYRVKYGLDAPLPIQFGIAFRSFLTGDLGDSISLYKPVRDAIGERLPGTIQLAGLGVAIGGILAVFLGVAAAVFRGRWPDIILTSLSSLGMSLPTFYIGLWVLMIFARRLGVIPVLSNAQGVSYWQSMFGPLLTMVVGETSLLMRTTRSSMLEIFNEDFIRTARAKGLPERWVMFKHALGNAMIPIITVTGYNLATAFGGAIVLETVFTRNGVGSLLIGAINTRDYPLIQGSAVIIAMLMILVNILTDIVYGFVDPRIRVSGE
jgi:ABC-type dipeptide/oligopeptide/nickel transport system permease component